MELEKVIAERKSKKIYKAGNYCVKLFDSDFSKADVLNEALNQARVEQTDLNIPKVEEVTKIDGKLALVMDYIKGKTLAELMKENPKKFDEYMDMFVDIQNDMHKRTCPLLNKWHDKMHRKIDESGLDATTRYELNTRISGMPKHNKLCHGDFNPSNIIVGDDGKNYIIDWSHATQGNAGADAARTYLYFNLYYDKKTADIYLDKFCAKTDTAKQYIQGWLPILAASQLVKSLPEEREFLLKWANVVDYE